MKLFSLFGLLFASAAASAAAPRLGLDAGESLTYRVSWVIVPGAGQIDVAAQTAIDPAGLPALRIVTTTATRGLAHLLLPFKAQAESLFSLANGRMVSLAESSSTRDKHAAHTVTFDYGRHQACYAEAGRPDRLLELPPGLPMDLINCLVSARTWDLSPGGTRDALVLFEDDVYQLTIHALGYEEIDTPLGTFRALVLEPKMEKTPPLGMFKRGSTVKVWISQDAQHLPVRFKVAFKIGAGVATLVRHQLPTGAK